MADAPIGVAVLISGRGSNMQALVDHARDYRVVLVASDRPDAPGLAWAAARGVATFALSPKGIGKPAYEAAMLDQIISKGAQVVALAGYMRLLTLSFIATMRGNIVNIHPSLLPLYKGLDTHARALAAGDAEAGCSVHLVTPELDAGRVLGQSRVPVIPGDTPDALAARVLVAEHQLYPRIVSEFCRRMNDLLSHVRAVALRLPGVAEPEPGRFTVADRAFARIQGGELWLGDDRVVLSDDPDWQLVEDRVARAWELAAPSGLLEAGGR